MNRRGFTIVELLIVIVVIGILAAITIVAFNGIQQRTTNASIVSTANSWVKALKTYKSANGSWPNAWTCVGEGYLYGATGTDTTGTAQCRQNAGGTGGVGEQAAFKNLMRPYFNDGALPTPIMVTALADTGEWRRGIHYAYGGGGTGTEVYMQIALRGDIGSTCPVIQGHTGNRAIWGGNSMCSYVLGSTADT
jgi:prepilin-type N-terminal cleavage/methylation domain-containing protein